MNNVISLENAEHLSHLLHNIPLVEEPLESPVFPATDTGNAERLTHYHGRDIRFCYETKRWFVWDGQHWEENAQAAVEARVKDTVRGIIDREGLFTPDSTDLFAWSKKSESRDKRSSMLSLAQSEKGIQCKMTDWDADNWLLPCGNGTLDLRKGKLHGHRREDLMTRIITTPYDPDAKADLWLAFLNRIFANNQTLISYLQRIVGYTLTGDTSEQCLFLCHGPGANGKSVLLETISSLLGDFAQASPMTTFSAKTNDNGASNDLARMRGARLITASETNEGVRLNEALIKKVTGQDQITARFLFSEFFDYRPQFKLWLAMNHKPVIRGVDDGIWRRIRLMPFSVIIPEKERDKTLTEKLRAELPGILAWAVRGCLDWQKNGMDTPSDVLAATEGYRSEQDVLGAFFDECCVIGEGFSVKTSDLWEAYKRWAEQGCEYRMTQTLLGRRLADRGMKKEHTKHGNFWDGIGLLSRSSY